MPSCMLFSSVLLSVAQMLIRGETLDSLKPHGISFEACWPNHIVQLLKTYFSIRALHKILGYKKDF